jgi:putative endonuclease
MSAYFYVYVLLLANGSYYTGYARDPLERLGRHSAGRGSRLARSFPPRALAGCWRVRGGRSEAMRVEAFIKACPRAVKELLLRDPSSLAARLRRQTGSRLRPLPFLAFLDPRAASAGRREEAQPSCS